MAWNNSISTKLSLLSVAIVLVTTTVLGAKFISDNQNDYIEREIDSLKTQLMFRLDKLEHGVMNLRNDITFFSQLPDLLNYVRAGSSRTLKPRNEQKRLAEKLTQVLMAWLKSEPQYTQLRFITPDGMEKIRVERNNLGDVISITGSELQDKSERLYFKNTIKLNSDQTYMSDINLNKEYGLVEVPYVRTIRIAKPVFLGSNQASGIVIINMNFGTALDEASIQPSGGGVVMIVDRDGYFIAHNDPSMTFGRELNTNVRLPTKYPEISNLFFAEGVTKEKSMQLFKVNNDIVHIARAYAYPESSQWFAGIIQLTSYETLANKAADFTRQNLLFIFFLIVIASIVTVVFSTLLTRRLQKISSAARRVADGDTNTPLPDFSKDEIGTLSRAFNFMLLKVYHRESKLKSREERLNTILQTVVNGVITIDDQGIIETINPSALKLFQYSEYELVGKNIRILMPENYAKHHDTYINNYLETGEKKIIGKYREVSGKRKDGKVFPMHLAINEARMEGERIFVGVVQDITQQKKNEKQISDYAAKLEANNRELKDFAYIASHDLQEPLRKIQAFGDRVLEKELDRLSDVGQDYLNRIINAASRMQSLINSLLILSRVGTRGGDFESVDLNLILREVCSDLETSISAANATIDNGPLPVVKADSVQMRQLFQNLISNSVKFAKKNSNLFISVDVVRNQILGEQPGFVHISVEDNGIGFDSKYHERVFKPFERLHARSEYEGTGMGLAICRKIVERHGGKIIMNSAIDVGTQCCFSLPLNVKRHPNVNYHTQIEKGGVQ